MVKAPVTKLIVSICDGDDLEGCAKTIVLRFPEHFPKFSVEEFETLLANNLTNFLLSLDSKTTN